MQTIYKINTKTMQNRHCKYVGAALRRLAVGEGGADDGIVLLIS